MGFVIVICLFPILGNLILRFDKNLIVCCTQHSSVKLLLFTRVEDKRDRNNVNNKKYLKWQIFSRVCLLCVASLYSHILVLCVGYLKVYSSQVNNYGLQVLKLAEPRVSVPSPASPELVCLQHEIVYSQNQKIKFVFMLSFYTFPSKIHWFFEVCINIDYFWSLSSVSNTGGNDIKDLLSLSNKF